MLRVRRNHTCISLDLFKKDEKHACDKCCAFRQRQQGMGRKLGKGAIPKCERPWFIENTDNKNKILLLKNGNSLQF